MPHHDDSLDRLLDEAEGVFVVITDDGVTHHLDMDQRLVTRTDEVSPRVRIVVDSAPASILTVATCRLGVPMVLLIDRNAPGVQFTRRTTAAVISIESAFSPARPTTRTATS
ncbi:hypothetical protein ACTU6U_14775 [Microbacterium sp. A196]|uniref:hypothetical protein n=1 Tax=Microbacterium sp. A196 TaxID=3457320 RepID=UPI003FD201BF